ncbi:MAG: hypothetical protein Q7S48_01260 [bacterium]|nr:hypothetical protein [bacterium]
MKRYIAEILVGVILFCVMVYINLSYPIIYKKAHENLKAQVEELAGELHNLQEYLNSDPRFFLFLMDRDLDAIERGDNSHGNFIDDFVPNAAKALKAGATRKEIDIRINRVIALAEKNIYLSSFVEQLMKEGGAKAVRAYVNASIRPKK